MNSIPYKNSDGSVYWQLNGKHHREDGPAFEGADGYKAWWLYGLCHREDGPAKEFVDGHKEWWLNGKRHREDGPAYEGADGHKQWWLNGEQHREDGPAIEYPDGKKEWLINGCGYNNYKFAALKGNFIIIERGIPTDAMFGSLKLTNAKLLTATGSILVWDNLPGEEIVEGDE